MPRWQFPRASDIFKLSGEPDVTTIKPILLLADSQLLFHRGEGEEGSFLAQRVRPLLDEEEPNPDPKAAYLGASNGDAPEFYELFQSAMSTIGIRTCRLIPTEPSATDRDFLAEADLILLAGGDTRRGYRAFEAAGIKDRIVERYYGGALLIGISAGAVQLGLKGWDEEGQKLFDTFRMVPFVVDVHDEPSWSRLLQAVPRAGEHAKGFGIPTGGGAIYHPDYSVEPVRHPLTEVSLGEEGDVRQALLFPGERSDPEEGEAGEVQALPESGGADPVN
jgi:peptidase E